MTVLAELPDYNIEKSSTIDENVLLVVIIASMLIMIQGSVTRKNKDAKDKDLGEQSLSEIVDEQLY